jgi:hypothetical protein
MAVRQGGLNSWASVGLAREGVTRKHRVRNNAGGRQANSQTSPGAAGPATAHKRVHSPRHPHTPSSPPSATPWAESLREPRPPSSSASPWVEPGTGARGPWRHLQRRVPHANSHLPLEVLYEVSIRLPGGTCSVASHKPKLTPVSVSTLSGGGAGGAAVGRLARTTGMS